ncbi:hypothetical protein EV702DRAFT_1048452 [Suillus placidus]|uniref:Uncharacterized protein n=1 Tax=Suillus placidus TaxID=48579 RepID=A0A9P6ZNR1_9AGAM|nr:hypothetical protein EV702DRAFT_1048452 [Suillus placidus]
MWLISSSLQDLSTWSVIGSECRLQAQITADGTRLLWLTSSSLELLTWSIIGSECRLQAQITADGTRLLWLTSSSLELLTWSVIGSECRLQAQITADGTRLMWHSIFSPTSVLSALSLPLIWFHFVNLTHLLSDRWHQFCSAVRQVIL